MQFNVDWLKKWVAVDLDGAALAERLTASGLEVDDVRPVAGDFTDVVVAEITECGKHPNADKLSLCMVDDGSGEALQIVCGAPNARAGIRVPLARVGGRIGPDFRIKRAKVRGVESGGMICSVSELGLAESSEGIMALPGTAPVGEDFRTYLGLDDQCIELDLTPDRADCLTPVSFQVPLAILRPDRRRRRPIRAKTPPTANSTSVLGSGTTGPWVKRKRTSERLRAWS